MTANRSAFDWQQDFQRCLRGLYGDWWRLRAQRAHDNRQAAWHEWRRVRLFEQEPEQGLLRLIRNDEQE